MTRKCINCSYIGNQPLDVHQNCPVCGDKTREATEEEIKNYNDSLKDKSCDLNNDGLVNEKDTSIAGKVLAKSKKGKRRR